MRNQGIIIMLELRLAFRNLMGARLRTWLNVSVISLCYVIIIWHQGLYLGMLNQGIRDMISDEVGGGQYWHEKYDPYDPLTLSESHGPIPEALKGLIGEKKALPILITSATIYPGGRMLPVLLKGIPPSQKVLSLPTSLMRSDDGSLPIIAGSRMAASNSLKKGDRVTIRLRDVHGTFDAIDGTIVAVFHTNVSTIDAGQLWIPIEALQRITSMHNEATLVVAGSNLDEIPKVSQWVFRDRDYLLGDLVSMVNSKRVSSGILYLILLFLAMIAIFDTQVLSIFHRKKEIGTLISLGMTRGGVILLFTIEGMLHGVLAMLLGALYGIPVFIITARAGIPLPVAVSDYGFAVSQRLFPIYTVTLIALTVFIVMVTVTIVSYLPAQKISRLNPVDALRGRIT